jgi:DNA-binding HxlR family transcriptional regulator
MGKVLSLGDLALQSRDVIELLSNKWRIPILHILRNGPLRTSEIQGAMSQVSAKVLTQTLRGMEWDGLIDRHIFTVVPPHVEYALTDMGRSLIQPLQDLCRWAESHVAGRDAARRKFDLAAKSKQPSSPKRPQSQKRP